MPLTLADIHRCRTQSQPTASATLLVIANGLRFIEHLNSPFVQSRNGEVKMDRSTPEGETAFRRKQKWEEIQHALNAVPSSITEFLNSPVWKRNANKNLVFNAPKVTMTIFSKYGTYNWVFGGGQPSYGPGGFQTEDHAKKSLWDFLHDAE